MSKHDEVVSDIITAMNNIKYDDNEKKLLLLNLSLNIYKFAGDQESYKENINVLNQAEKRKKEKILVIGVKKDKKR